MMVASRRFAAMDRIAPYCFMGALCLVLGSSLSMPTATTQHPPRALTLSTYIQCPTYPISGKTPITLHADISGTEDARIVKDVIFDWSVSQGSIVSGQGTRKLVFDPSVK